MNPRLPSDYRYLYDVAVKVDLGTESAKALCRVFLIPIAYLDGKPVISELDSKKFYKLLKGRRLSNHDQSARVEDSDLVESALTHEEDQARLNSAGVCAKCKKIWARFSDNFCEEHSPKGWRKSATKDFVQLQLLIEEVRTDREEMRRVCHVLGVAIAYVGGVPKVSPTDESRIRDEFRLRETLRPQAKQAHDAPRSNSDDRIPLRLPATGNFDFLNFNNMHLERRTYLEQKSNQVFSGRSFVQCSFRNCHLEEVDFSGSDLSGADFSDSHLFGCRFDRATLDGGKFDHAVISAGSFREATIKQASFSRSIASADFSVANLTLTSFVGSVLKGSDFSQAQLVHCDFSGADLRNASFREAHIDGLLLKDARYEPVQLSGPSPNTIVESPYLRQHYNSDGLGKISYASRTAAAAAALSLQATENRKVNHYECRLCRKWHIGHAY